MTETEVHAVIESYLEENWVDTSIFFHQVPDFPDAAEEFISLWIIPGGTVQMSVGSTPGWRGVCIIQIDVNIPSRMGTRRAVELGDQVSELFLGKDLSGITVRDKVIHEKVIGDYHRRSIRFNGFYTYTH